MTKIILYNDKYKNDVVRLVLDVYENELGFKGYERPDIYSISDTTSVAFKYPINIAVS